MPISATCATSFAPAGEVDDDDLVGAHLRRGLDDLGDGVARLERRDDALELGQLLECRQRLGVGCVGVLDAVRVAQPSVLRADGGVVQAGGDAVRELDLAVLILQHKRARALQHTESAARESSGVFAVDDALAAGLDAGHRHRLVAE